MNGLFWDFSFLSSCIAVVCVCSTAAIWGTFLLLSKKSLISETISHSAYPGLLFGVIISELCPIFLSSEFWIVSCGCLTAVFGFYCVNFMETRLRLTRDAALCLVLIVAFGIGITLTSYVRGAFPKNYAEVQSYFYGQAATLIGRDVIVSGLLLVTTALFVLVFYRSLLISSFDPEYAFLSKLNRKYVQKILFIFVSLVVVIGVKSVGVILISAMFVGPPLIAKQFAKRLSSFIWIAMISGGLSGIIGSVLSLVIRVGVRGRFIYLPTGPLIVLVATFMVIGALLFGYERGLVPRLFRRAGFLVRRQTENFLKTIWIVSDKGTVSITIEQLSLHPRFQELFCNRRVLIMFMIEYLYWKGALLKTESRNIALSEKGVQEALRLVRLHRLWEVYLVNFLAFPTFEVHPLAEEIEHTLTHEMDRSLTDLLSDPEYDPHNQLIPRPIKRRKND